MVSRPSGSVTLTRALLAVLYSYVVVCSIDVPSPLVRESSSLPEENPEMPNTERLTYPLGGQHVGLGGLEVHADEIDSVLAILLAGAVAVHFELAVARWGARRAHRDEKAPGGSSQHQCSADCNTNIAWRRRLRDDGLIICGTYL